MDYVDTLIERHETLWTKGELKRTKHRIAEIYTLSYPKCGEEYIAKNDEGWVRLAGAPHNVRHGVSYGTISKSFKTFDDLRQNIIDDFPDYRQRKKGNTFIVSF